MKLIGIAAAAAADRASKRNSTVGALRFVKDLPPLAPNRVSNFEALKSWTTRSRPTGGGRGIGSREGGMCKIMGSITGMRLVRLLLGILNSILNFKLHEVGDQRKNHI